MGRSRGGLTTKIHALVDALGLPILLKLPTRCDGRALLLGYGIRSSTIRMTDGSTPKGYKREAFHDTWKRYLPVSVSDATSATSATDCGIPEEFDASGAADGIAPRHVAEALLSRNAKNP